MSPSTVGGYAGKILRVDLTNERVSEETLDEATLRKWVGGAGFGAKYLYEEVPPGVEWSDPQNRLIFATGPLGGTRVAGSGTFSVSAKGPLTNGATATQANGYLGAYMKFSGYDGIVIQGAAKRWLYLHLHDGTAELRDASHLVGKDVFDTEDAIKKELGYTLRGATVYGIGPAGENLVKFAAIIGDKGHAAGHNGVGAVMGSKKLKAVVAGKGAGTIAVNDSRKVSSLARKVVDELSNDPARNSIFLWGTFGNREGGRQRPLRGTLPVKNLTTNIFPESEFMTAEYARTLWPTRPNPCWACAFHHCRMMRITTGPYAGLVAEEPEYECTAAMGPTIGNTDVAGMIMLSDLTDRLGLEVNEAGWLMGMVMECYERGVITKGDTDGVELNWGNVEGARAMLNKIARREGFGDILAEGVMRSSQKIGGEALNMAVHTFKGGAPRGHDHRAMWREVFDTAVGSTGTYEAGVTVVPQELGLPSQTDPFSPDDTVLTVAKSKGRRQFEDTLGTCTFCTRLELQRIVDIFNAATGWEFDLAEAQGVGYRIANLLKVFNLRHGINSDRDAITPRYRSAPVDGPAKGISIAPHWDKMVHDYYEQMGWDRQTSRPLPETLRRLGLGDVVAHIW